MFYEKLNHKDIKKLRNNPFFLPVGTLEPHSDGPLGTDALIPDYIALQLAKKLEGVKLPCVYYGITSSLYGYPGAVRISPDVFKGYIENIGISLKRSGIKYLFIINGHGGQINELKDVASLLWRREALFTAVVNWWIAVEEISKQFFGTYTGHAGADELAMVSGLIEYDPKTWKRENGLMYVKGINIYPFPEPQIHYESGEGKFEPQRIDEYREKVIDFLCLKIKDILERWKKFKND